MSQPHAPLPESIPTTPSPESSDALSPEALEQVTGGSDGGSVWNFHVWNHGVVDPNRKNPPVRGG